MMDILEVAAGLEAPHDMVFIAREVGQRIRAQAAVREQIRELQKRSVRQPGSQATRGRQAGVVEQSVVRRTQAVVCVVGCWCCCRYIVKQSEAQDELTVTFPEGVVATCQLLPGYPEVAPPHACMGREARSPRV